MLICHGTIFIVTVFVALLEVNCSGHASLLLNIYTYDSHYEYGTMSLLLPPKLDRDCRTSKINVIVIVICVVYKKY